MSCPLSMADCQSTCQSKMIKKMHQTLVSVVSHQAPDKKRLQFDVLYSSLHYTFEDDTYSSSIHKLTRKKKKHNI